MSKTKILFAIGSREAEEYIMNTLNNDIPDEYDFVGAAVYKENLIELINLKKPDILIIREGLDGKVDIFNLAKNITRDFPFIRVIFISADRKIGDKKLAELVGYHIFDIVSGTTVSLNFVIDLVKNPQTFAEASKYLPKKEDLISEDDFTGLENMDEDDENSNKNNGETIIESELIPDESTANDKLKKEPSLLEIAQSKLLERMKAGKNKPKDTSSGGLTEEQALDLKKALEEINKLKEKNDKKEEKENKPDKSDKIPIPKNPYRRKRPERSIFTNKEKFFGKDKIVTFWGAKNGIGTTLISYNVAMDLALRNYKVLFVEFNEKNPMIPYWFDVYGKMPPDDGIDKAVLGFETGNYQDIDKSVITRQELITNVGASFKSFPPTLDYLFFSSEYLERRDKPIISRNSLSQVLLHYMRHLNYNYIILDMNTNSDVLLVENALTFSNKNYIVVSQEFSSIGYYQLFFSNLAKKGLDFSKKYDGSKDASEKNSFIINRFDNKADFNLRTIVDWLATKKVFTVCDNSSDIYNLSFSGLPIMLKSNNKIFKQNIRDISTDIERV